METIYRISGYAGALLIVAGALLYVAILSHPDWIVALFTAGVVLLTLNRFCGDDSDYTRSRDTALNISVRRLYRQRWIATLLLYLSVMVMVMPKGFYWGVYNNHSLWFIPFLIFTVVEVVCVFRIKEA